MGSENKEIRAHIALVVARSSWLRDRIREAIVQRKERDGPGAGAAASDGDPLTVQLFEADPKAFELVLHYIYTDQIDPTRNNRELAASNEVVLTMMQVYTLATTFHMRRLELLCAQYIENSINLKNVLVALNNASRLKLLFVKDYCQRFITKEQNYSQIVMSKDFETLDQPLMVEIIRQRQCPNPGGAASAFRPSGSGGIAAGGGATSPGGGGLSPDQYRQQQQQQQLEETHTLREDMKHFLLGSVGKEFADIQLSLGSGGPDGGATFPSHRAILAARSSYFEGKFRSFRPADNTPVPIAIGEMVPSKQSFQSLLGYIYYGDTTMPPEDSLYLFSASLFYIFTNNRLQVWMYRRFSST